MLLASASIKQVFTCIFIDIAAVIDSFGGDIMDIFFLLLKLRRNIDIRIELHPFKVKDFNDSNPFACEIIRTGKKIS
ncbi:unnamed protein product [marine sediment metagenome]|uniref:Uncharacterized protein n=1 Tax=marine sediment metagenome TaxID=412755 RepID=X1B3F1_9ZZZZ